MTTTNFGDLWDAHAAAAPNRTAIIQGDQTVSWSQFERRSHAIARYLHGAGLPSGAVVAQYLYNGPEYLESVYGCFKASYWPVNTNYRYTVAEITDIWTRADVQAVVFDEQFIDTVDAVRAALPNIKRWVVVGSRCPTWAERYADIVERDQAAPLVLPWRRSGDDICLLYTGGTTGAPKAVMWAQEDLAAALGSLGDGYGPESDPVVLLPAPPMMHGVGLFTAFLALNEGGTVVSLGRRFDPIELLDAVQQRRVNVVTIVGDAFARPIVQALAANEGRWDLRSLRSISSSGMILTDESKKAILHHLPWVTIADGLGASELVGAASAIITSANSASHPAFRLSDRTRVVDDTNRDVKPGSGAIGRLAVRGITPRGYYGDPEATAATFPIIDGVRYALGGDYVTVDADGLITLLGRGSLCINTGGEKVYPDEVEAALRAISGIADVAVLGVPNATYGEVVAAVIVPEQGVEPPTLEAITTALRGRLASYKAPRQVLVKDSLNRGANGKVAFPELRSWALAQGAT